MNRPSSAWPCAAAFALGALLATSAPAQPPGEATVLAPGDGSIRTERVTLAGLDLRNRPGQRTLYRRVGLAVKHVCSFDGIDDDNRLSCEDDAWAGSRPQIRGAIQRAEDYGIAATSISILVTAAR